MKRIAFVVVAIMLPFSFSACGSAAVEPDGSTNNPESPIYGKVQRIEVDGVPCIIFDADGGGGALSCDWDSAVG